MSYVSILSIISPNNRELSGKPVKIPEAETINFELGQSLLLAVLLRLVYKV